MPVLTAEGFEELFATMASGQRAPDREAAWSAACEGRLYYVDATSSLGIAGLAVGDTPEAALMGWCPGDNPYWPDAPESWSATRVVLLRDLAAAHREALRVIREAAAALDGVSALADTIAQGATVYAAAPPAAGAARVKPRFVREAANLRVRHNATPAVSSPEAAHATHRLAWACEALAADALETAAAHLRQALA